MPSFTCTICGSTFTLAQTIVDRYPGWTPKQCLDCRPTKATTDSAAKQPKSRSTVTRSENLPVAEILERFHDGPMTGVFTDGSSVPNPGPGGWGAVYVIDNEIIGQDHGHDSDTTNNRMELLALIRGIDLVPNGESTIVYTDSRLAVQTINEWAKGWERAGWKRKTGPIKNLDLVKELYAKTNRRPEIKLQWVKAHAGNRWNEYADALSTAWQRAEL